MFEKIKKIFNRNQDNEISNNEDNDLENIKIDNQGVKFNKSNKFKKVSNDKDSSFSDIDWFSDRYQSLIYQRNTMMFLLVFAVVSLSILGILIFFLFKNKTVEPFLIEVDKKTGFVTFLKKDTKIASYTEDKMVRNYFIKKYLDARETLDPKNFDYFYNKVVFSFSSPQVFRQFNSLLRSNEKSNPFIAYDNNLDCKIFINSINEIGYKVVQVRFIVDVLFQDGKRTRINKIATINYDFFNYEMDLESRYINPLGFLITNYRVVDENF